MTKEIDLGHHKLISWDTSSIEEIEPFASFILKAPTIYGEAKKDNGDCFLIQNAFDYLSRIKEIPFDESRCEEEGYFNTFFKDKYEFYIAGLLLKDGILPLPVCKAYVEKVEYAQVFLEANKINCPDLYLLPKKRGRKENEIKYQRMKVVKEALENGYSIEESYQLSASKYFVSLETIRRDYERWGHKLSFEGKLIFEIKNKETYYKK